MAFDIVSDLHIDAWINFTSDIHKTRKQINTFIQKIIPTIPSRVLIIAGDLGHYNFQNEVLLQEFKKSYRHILLVFGNHDLYLIDNFNRKLYNDDSLLRWNEMRQKAEAIEGIKVLEGDRITIEGITFGGTGGWYDFSYGQTYLDATNELIKEQWHKSSNDSKKIFGKPANVIDFSNVEKRKLVTVIQKSDVIITHIPPLIAKLFDVKYEGDLLNSFYYMDIGDHVHSLNGKIWVSGHVHLRNDIKANGCEFLNASIGYPLEGRLEKKQIVTIG